MTMIDPILCPECDAGKHVNCNGQAWNFTHDKPVPCECPDESHR